MNIPLAPLATFLLMSVALNIYFWIEYAKTKRMAFDLVASERAAFENKRIAFEKEIEALKKVPTYDCAELIQDLSNGGALIKVTRLDPMEIYIRR